MGRVAIATENRTGEGGDRFPKIKLTEKGQKCRFTLIEVPWREYVHYLKAPSFGENGKPQKEFKTRRNGDKYEDYKLEFLSSPICLGDEAVLQEKGMDPKNCPACEAAEKSGGDIPGPVQRFAVNVIEYGLRGNTWEVKKPFTADIKVWTFTGRIYDEIEGIQQQIGDLRKHDITLECEDPYWQRNKLAFQMEPGYKAAPQGYIKELLTTPGNKASDAQLKDACGRDVPRARLQDDCDHVLRQWRRLRNEGQESSYDTSTGADLEGGIDALLNDEGGSGTQAQDTGNALTGGGEDPFAEFSEETTSNPSPAAAGKQEEAASRKAAASASAGPSDEPPPADTPASQTAALPSEEDIFGEAEGSSPAAHDHVAAEAPAAKQETAAPADDFDFDDLMSGIQ